jgi:hypothetical protein
MSRIFPVVVGKGFQKKRPACTKGAREHIEQGTETILVWLEYHQPGKVFESGKLSRD